MSEAEKFDALCTRMNTTIYECASLMEECDRNAWDPPTSKLVFELLQGIKICQGMVEQAV